jgi:Carboxypeptidase regulatory-like domain
MAPCGDVERAVGSGSKTDEGQVSLARVARPCVALLVVFAGAAAPCAAQAVYGSLAGTVTDASGARVAGALVTLTSLERGTVDTVASNASGYYLKDRLLPGRYELKAALAGFRTQVVSPIVVGVDAQTKVDPILEPGDVAESVTVDATGGQLCQRAVDSRCPTR